MASLIRYAELHVHLEGMLDQETLCEIAPELDGMEVKRKYAFSDFPGFLESFKFAALHLHTPEQYRLLARRAFARMAKQGIVYAEVIHSAGICLWRKQDARAIAEALIEEGRQAPLQVRWVLDAVRQFGGAHAMEVARLAADLCGEDVVAFGVGGDERGAAAAEICTAFRFAEEAGLKLAPHAGETSNAQNVWDALELGAHRIGHGIRAIEDPQLVRELAARQVPLEISISSNVLTGAVATLAAHPAKQLFDAGVPITLNTDDPAFFGTTIEREFAIAKEGLGFTDADLEVVRENAFRFAFSAPSAT
ncbi:adenosine deaminase [Bryobacter aggregatus]|uniref:adenosine deaminase n=1 Tax=Bryobacter aggregatus TaxID=360054 RepID=UPI000B20719A|nr:adenosine deaminase [Bryobacter aggregatus]